MGAMTMFEGKTATQIKDRAKYLYGQVQKLREEGAILTKRGFAFGEISAGAWVAGYLNGSKGTVNADGSIVPYQWGQYDVDMTGGIVLGLSGLLGFGGEYSDHLVNVGAGMFGSWANREGFAMGRQHATQAAA